MNPREQLKSSMFRAAELITRASVAEASDAPVTTIQTLLDAASNEVANAQTALAVMRAGAK